MNLYQEELMHHYRNPYNRMQLETPDLASQEHNPSCGDSISFQGMVLHKNITQLAFDGKGCVISQGAASMLCQLCTNKNLDEVMQLDKDFILSMIGIPLGPTRLKCALISLQALQQAIITYKNSKA